MSGSVWSFLGVLVVVYAVPGPDFAIVLRWSIASRQAGMRAAAGTVAGLLVHATAAGVGLSALLATSAQAFAVVKLVGAAYLIILGLLALRSGLRRPSAAQATDHGGGWTGGPWRQAFLTNVLNPKAALFFVALLPQFVGSAHGGGTTVTLAAITVAFGALWWPSVVLLAARVANGLRRPRVRRALDAVTGSALVGLGARLAATR